MKPKQTSAKSGASKAVRVRILTEWCDAYADVYERKPQHGASKRFVIYGFPPGLTAAKLKRLVEIAALDEAALVELTAMTLAGDEYKSLPDYTWAKWKDTDVGEEWRKSARAALRALGLSPARAKKKSF